MAASFSLSDSLKVRQQITQSQYREIQQLYKDLAEKAKKEAEKLKTSTVSGRLQQAELKKLQETLQKEAEKIGEKLEGNITGAMKKAAEGVVSDAVAFNSKLGIGFEGAYRNVPTDIVETLTSGKLYKGKWTLSKSIWADVGKTQSDISKVIAEGIALNKSSYDIAKDLEMYVDPSAKKPWDWSKVYPGTKKKVDYNAQRLARTMVGHAYQQSVVAVCKEDPFVDGVKWISGHSTTTCELCKERNGKIFPVNKLPLDHPNGKCSFAPALSKSMAEIGDDLADWVQGKPNKKLDNWAKSMYPEDKKSDPVEKKKSSTQNKKAKEWDEAYDRVVEFAKKQGSNIDDTVRAILGKPPVGSKHYKGASDSIAKVVAVKKPKEEAITKRPEFSTMEIVSLSRSDANAYVDMIAKKYSSKVSSAIEDYTMFSDDINGYLRGTIPYDDYRDQIKILSGAMKKGKEEAVFRGCDSKVLGISPTLSEQEIKSRLIGTSYRDKGFLSTTLSKDVAEEFSQRGMDSYQADLPTVITMRVSKDTGKLYVNSGLGEIVLDKGSVMHFTDAKLVNGVLQVEAEVY